MSRTTRPCADKWVGVGCAPTGVECSFYWWPATSKQSRLTYHSRHHPTHYQRRNGDFADPAGERQRERHGNCRRQAVRCGGEKHKSFLANSFVRRSRRVKECVKPRELFAVLVEVCQGQSVEGARGLQQLQQHSTTTITTLVALIPEGFVPPACNYVALRVNSKLV